MSDKIIVRPIPSEKRPPDTRFLRLPHHELLMKPPFVCSVYGAIGSGKTSFLWTALDDLYKDYFDEVIIYCGTVDSKESWEGVHQRSVLFLSQFEPEVFREYLHELEAAQEERKAKGKKPLRVCVAFDDMIARGLDRNSGGKSSPLLDLILVCRHLNCSVIILSQDSKLGMVPAMRNNCTHVVMYQIKQNDIKKLAEEHCGEDMTPDEFIRLHHKITSVPYQFLMIDYKQSPEKRFRAGFDRFVRITRKEEIDSKALHDEGESSSESESL